MRSLIASSFLAIALLAGAPARADEALARQHYERGMKAYNLQEFKTALDQFKGAYVEKPDPAFLFNIAQCQRQLGQYIAAGKSYRAYLNQSPDGNRDEVEAIIKRMDDAARDEQTKSPPAGTLPPQPALVAAMPPTSTSARWYKRPAGWTVAGSGVAVGLIGMGLWLHGNALDGQIGSASSLADAQQLGRDRDSFRTAGEVLVGIGGAALVAGVVVLAIRAGHQSRSTP